ncbi:MAG TPA: multicopper oxidase domain-containing protein [Actinomycetaceae bacterium]|nr:multicopper oxidase domain-containing protein [Actinomycetaceae bacterium]
MPPASAPGSRARWHRVTGAVVLLWLLAGVLAAIFHRDLPAPAWLMVHVTLLGAVSNALLIWTQHFTRAIARTRVVAGRREEAVRLVAFNVAVLVVIAGIISGRNPVTLAGAIGVAGVAAAHAWSIATTVRGALPGRIRAPARYYAAAAILLVPGAVLGWSVVDGIGGPGIREALLSAHTAVNVLGWVGLPILGTLVTLWPTVIHTRMSESAESRARQMLPLLVAAILVIALAGFAGEAFDGSLGPLLARAFTALGLLGYVAAAAAVLQPAAAVTVREKIGDFPSLSLAAGTAWLLGTLTFAAGWIAIGGHSFSDAVGRLVIPLVGGGILQILLGALGYLLPVMAGGGPSVLRGRIARVNRGALWRVVAVNSALLFYVLPAPSLVLVTTTLTALAVAAISAARIAHATFGTPAPSTPNATSPQPAQTAVPAAAAPRPAAVSRDEAPTLGTRSGGLVVGIAVAALAVVGGVALDPAAAGVVGPLGGSRTVLAGGVNSRTAAPTGEITRVEVQVEGMRFVPASVEVPAGNLLEITLANTGDDVHDLVLADGSTTGRLSPGETGVLETGPITGDIDGWCSVAGHRQMGMVFAVTVMGGDGVADATAGTSSPGQPHDHTSGDTMGSGAGSAAVPDLQGIPGSGWEPRDPVLPPLTETTEHHVTLEVTEQVVEVAPGVAQSRWTFGGSAPGPVLRGRIGDSFVITLVNEGTIGHSIDFHAGALAPDQPMRTIQPGETLVYRFTATRAGIWMYHCSTMPMSMHIAQGMYGAVVIEPDGLPDVDHEFILVQGESYLGPEGGESDAARIASGDHDLVHFNGYPFQYEHAPLEVGVGERVRIWVLDAGPNVASSFHVVGGQFDTVWMEGDYRLRPGGAEDGIGAGGGAQALGLLPAQGGFVELELPEAGNYPFVSHIMSDAEKGAHGILRAVD